MAGGFRRRGRLFQLSRLPEPLDDPRMAGATHRRTGSLEPSRRGGDGFVLRLGHLSVNRRHDDHREDLVRYKVTRLSDLRDVIIKGGFVRTPEADNCRFCDYAAVCRYEKYRIQWKESKSTGRQRRAEGRCFQQCNLLPVMHHYLPIVLQCGTQIGFIEKPF